MKTNGFSYHGYVRKKWVWNQYVFMPVFIKVLEIRIKQLHDLFPFLYLTLPRSQLWNTNFYKLCNKTF